MQSSKWDKRDVSNMKKQILSAALVFISILVNGCSGSKSDGYHGVLYYGWGQKLNSVNLETGERATLYSNPDMVIMSVTGIGMGKFLFGSNRISFRTDPVVQIFDRTEGKISAFGSGESGSIEHPAYLPAHHAIVFYSVINRKLVIAWADINNPDHMHAIDAKNNGLGYQLVPVSDDEVAYSDGEKPWLINLKSGVTKELNISGCVPQLWRSKTRQLLCSKGDSFDYFLTNLDGSGRQALDMGQNHVPVYYIPQLDIAIFNGTRLGLSGDLHEVGTLWFYDFGQKSMTKVVDDAMVGAGAVIWYPA
jgi:hypothetical protein